MTRRLRGYKLCRECGQPMLKKGQRRKHLGDYRHATDCPAAPADERRRWAADRRIEQTLEWRTP